MITKRYSQDSLKNPLCKINEPFNRQPVLYVYIVGISPVCFLRLCAQGRLKINMRNGMALRGTKFMPAIFIKNVLTQTTVSFRHQRTAFIL